MGVLLLIVGLGALGFGFLQHLKGKRILAAPFKKTGDIANDPISSDPKGMMSTEGNVVPPTTPVLSAMSKTPCLYFEVSITRKWEKTEQTQDGAKTTKGSSHVETIKGGAIFGLDDGSGQLLIDATKGGDFDNLKKQGTAGGTFMADGYMRFGELRIPTPPASSDDYTLGFEAVEKIVPVGGSLFALGKLENGKLSKPGWRSMMFSTKGRDGLLASTAKKKKFSFIGGGIGAVAGIPLMIFAPSSPSPESTSCGTLIAAVQKRCQDNVTSASGNAYTWTVEKAGPYSVEVIPPEHKKFPLDAQVVVKDAAAEVIADQVAKGPGSPVVATLSNLKPGAYTVTVKDVDGTTVKGGFDYALEVRSDATVPGPVADADDDLANRVAELNELCADTWCEGSFNYKFTRLSCDGARGCALAFTATHSDTRKNYDAMVIVKGFTALRSDPSKEYKYEGSFDAAVGDALSKWEAHPTNKAPMLKSNSGGASKNVAAAGKPKHSPKPRKMK